MVWSGAVVRVVAIVLATAAVGWGLLLFGLYAEADTGLPDGLACTGRLADSVDSYVDCMRREEGRAMIGWGLAAGLAAAGLVTLARSRGVSRPDLSQRVVTVLTGLASLSLAAAVVAVWIHGAGGGFYDDAFGPGRWNLTMGLGSTVGAVAGWVLSIGLKGSGTASAGSRSSGLTARSANEGRQRLPSADGGGGGEVGVVEVDVPLGEALQDLVEGDPTLDPGQ